MKLTVYDSVQSSVCRLGREKDAANLSAQIGELQSSRDSLLRELDELKVQLNIVEESRDGVRQNLTEAKRQLQEGLQSPLRLCVCLSVCVCVCVCDVSV